MCSSVLTVVVFNWKMQQIKFYGLNSSGWNDLASDNKKMEAKVKKKKRKKKGNSKWSGQIH